MPQRVVLVGALAAVGLVAAALVAQTPPRTLPAPTADAALASAPARQTAVLAGGCFWGMQEVFEHVRGVTRVVAGYSGGAAATARYDVVETGGTGHAESVELTFDASQITYGQILRVFFSVAHDPTQLNRQGPDEGPQYRSVIFTSGPDQERIARAYVMQLGEAHAFSRPIVTQIVPLTAFYAAEAYHQHYAALHPDEPYIVINDAPKITHLRQLFPDLFTK